MSRSPWIQTPTEFRRVEAIPKLGSGKTDFGAVKRLALAGKANPGSGRLTFQGTPDQTACRTAIGFSTREYNLQERLPAGCALDSASADSALELGVIALVLVGIEASEVAKGRDELGALA